MGILYIFIVGTVFGSFFGVILDRIPAHESIVFGRSHCNYCGRTLSLKDLIPIFSQIFSKFSCRYCHKKTSLIYLFLEISCGIIFVSGWLGLIDFTQFLFIILSVILSTFDYRYHSFPLVIWIIFTLILLLTSSSVLTDYIWLILSILAEIFDLKIGSGDFLWLFSASLSLTFLQEIIVIQIASILGITYFIIRKKRVEIAFIPFLTTAYISLILYQITQSYFFK